MKTLKKVEMLLNGTYTELFGEQDGWYVNVWRDMEQGVFHSSWGKDGFPPAGRQQIEMDDAQEVERVIRSVVQDFRHVRGYTW